ncbi:MAG: hypothetical protein KDJ65_10555 [Anaerolineae bacterium]|nr:hypothetical protein [Anaerolineae bacterium]
MTRYYNIGSIRAYLIEGFSEEELRAFCFDHLDFRDVHNQISENDGKSKIVHQLVEYADRRELFGSLLFWAKKRNPAKYEKHKPYWSNSPPTRPSKGPKMPKITDVLLQQGLNEIEEIKESIEEDLDKAIRRWWGIKQMTLSQGDEGGVWRNADLLKKLEDIWTYEIKDLEWQLELLRRAIANYHKGNINGATERATLIDQINPGDSSKAAVSAKLLVAFMKNDDQQIVNLAQEVDPLLVVEAVWWLYSFNDVEFSVIVKPIVAKTLSTLAGQTNAIHYVHQILHLSIDGQNLLEDPNFNPIPLQELASESPEQYHRELAYDLLRWRQAGYGWPPLWSDGLIWPPKRNTYVTVWLKEVLSRSLSYNPFSIRKAELEPNLFNLFVSEPFWVLNGDSWRTPQAAILFGEQGGGKTTIAFMLIREHRETIPDISKKRIFPVYFSLEINPSSEIAPSFFLDVLANTVARALKDFLVLNPYSFLDHHENQKFAIAALLTYSAGSTKTLETALKRTSLSNHTTGKWLIDQIIQNSYDFHPGPKLTEMDKIEILQQARPLGFDNTCILVDLKVKANTQKFNSTRANHLQPFLEIMLPLARAKIYVNLFLPLDLKKYLSIPAGIMVDELTWTPAELEKLVGARLSEASKGLIVSLSQLFDRDVLEEDITRLVKAAGNSPGTLFKLINQLIELQIEKTSFSKIDLDTLETVLKSANGEEGSPL